MKITRKSALTGIERIRDIPVNPEDYLVWLNDQGSIEEMMPYLNDADKQFILSGLIESEWKQAFAEIHS